ncbi:MAG: hypothetical protein ABR987_05890, partial [Terracidiphilus sp.]
MAELWQGVQSSLPSSPRSREGSAEGILRISSAKGRFWIILDVITVLVSASLAVVYKFHTTPVDEVKGFWHGT